MLAVAQSKPIVPTYATLTQQQQAYWHLINYYSGKNDNYVSEILNADFFVHTNGRVNPAAEFDAFLALVADLANHDQRKIELCQFPARLHWLVSQNLIADDLGLPTCSKIQERLKPGEIKSLSIVFASGYYGNPGSYYGHTLLRFNYADNSQDLSLNYGADAGNSPAGPIYAIKGIFGGYQAAYTWNDYFLHSYAYTNTELRDTWDYELALTPEQQNFIILHAWELMRARFRYYFFTDNCAHRIARLVEMATGEALSYSHGFWLLPSQVVQHLDRSTPKLVANKQRNLSLKTRFNKRYRALSQPDKTTFDKLLSQPESIQPSLLAEQNQTLLQLMLDYLDLENAKLTIAAQDTPTFKPKQALIEQQRASVLRELVRRPAQGHLVTDPSQGIKEKSRSRSPTAANPPSRLRLTAGVRDGSAVQSINYRVANNDLLMPPAQGQEISKFSMGELELEQFRGKTRVTRVVLFDLLNIATDPLPSQLGGERSWQFAIDYRNRSRTCASCRDVGVQGHTGRAYRLNPNTAVFGFVGARVSSTTSVSDDWLTLNTQIGMVVNTPGNSVLSLAGTGYFGTKHGETDWVWGLDWSKDLGSNFDVRLGFEKRGDDTWTGLSIAHYFH